MFRSSDAAPQAARLRLSGAVLAAAGAPYPFYTSFVEPVTAFSLIIGLNALAMPLIGGTKSWAGPVLGALLLPPYSRSSPSPFPPEAQHPLRRTGAGRFRCLRARRTVRSSLAADGASRGMSDMVLSTQGCRESLRRISGRLVLLTSTSLQASGSASSAPTDPARTTLINCITGVYRPDKGSVHFQGQDISHVEAHKRARLGISRSFQIPRPFTGMTVLENLLVPLDYCHVEGSKARSAPARSLQASGSQTGYPTLLKTCRSSNCASWNSPARWSAIRRC